MCKKIILQENSFFPQSVCVFTCREPEAPKGSKLFGVSHLVYNNT